MPSLKFNLSILSDISKFEKKLQDTSKLMKQIAVMGMATAIKAFEDQGLEGFPWNPRYPGQAAPKLNLAGALADFSAGRESPKPNRFQDRPALIDEGQRGGLKGSITFAVPDPETAQWGTNKEYALDHQLGLTVNQDVTDAAKEGIENWLYTPSSIAKGKPSYRKGREQFGPKLAPLLHKDVLTTNLNQRPFIGITPTLEGDIQRLAQEYFDGGK